MDKGKWTIVNMDAETRQAITKTAKAYDLTIPALLKLLMEKENKAEPEALRVPDLVSYKAWTLYQIGSDVKQALKALAIRRKSSINKALRYLIQIEPKYREGLKDKAQVKAEIKAQMLSYFEEL